MSIKKDKNGSFCVNNMNEVSAFSRIVFTPDNNIELEERYHNWIEECAKAVKPCSHTMEETEQFFLQQCDALPIDKEDYHMKSFQYSIVMSYFQDKQKQELFEILNDITDEEIERIHKQQRELKQEICNNSPEYYGIQMSGYYLPHTDNNLFFYEEVIKDMKEMSIYCKGVNMNKEAQSIYFFFEKSTGHIECSGGGRSLINKLLVFRGVNEEDIRLCNNRFLGYINSMRELGYLPDYHKE